MTTPILLLPGNAKAVKKAVGHLDPLHYGWLLTPRRTMTKTGLYDLRYGVDNECFTLGDEFSPERYKDALIRIAKRHGVEKAVFATAPDVVADAVATWERSRHWLKAIRELGFPAALVAQDGIESTIVQWSCFDAIFIGGSTAWKLSEAAAYIIKQAENRGKWTHVGRVNSWKRVDELRAKPQSIDGTHWAKKPHLYMVDWHNELMARKNQKPFSFYQEVKKWSMS